MDFRNGTFGDTKQLCNGSFEDKTNKSLELKYELVCGAFNEILSQSNKKGLRRLAKIDLPSLLK